MDSTQPLVHLVTIEELKGQAKKFYEGFAASGKKVPKWMQVMANCEDILVGFFTMFKATMDDAPLPAVLKWKVAKAVSDLNKCEFCVDVTNAQLRQFGLSEEEVADVTKNSNERELIALEYAKAATEKAYEIDEALIAKVKEHFNDEELVELTAAIGLFNYINKFNDALGVMPE